MESTQVKAEPAKSDRGLVKSREGVVVSNKMERTVVVAVTRQVRHGVYGKYIRKTKKYLVHDEENSCAEGDRVRIVETRPLSKRKRWKVQSIVRKTA